MLETAHVYRLRFPVRNILFLESRLVDVEVSVNSGTIRERTTNAWWTSYGVLHFLRGNKIKDVAVSVCSRPSGSRRSLNLKYCISVGRDIHVDVDIQVSKLQELVHGL